MEFKPINGIKRFASEDDGEVVPQACQRMGMIGIRAHVLKKYPQIMQAVFSQFIPLEIENSFVRNMIIYTGYSPHFDETPEGSYINRYDVVFHQDLMGNIEIKFKKADEADLDNVYSRKVTFF